MSFSLFFLIFFIIFVYYFHIFASDSFLTLVSERCEGCQSVRETDMVHCEAECESARQTDMVWPQSPLMNNLGSHVNNFSILNLIFLKMIIELSIRSMRQKKTCYISQNLTQIVTVNQQFMVESKYIDT